MSSRRCIFARDRSGGLVPADTVAPLADFAAMAGFGEDAELPDVVAFMGGEWRCELLGGRLAYRLWIKAAQ